MAQIIKHRRGNLEGLKDATTRAGELLVVTGSSGLGTIANGADLVFVGIDGSTASPVNKILQGTTVPDLTGASYNTHVDGIPFFDTDDEKLYILNKGGNVEVKATAQTGGTGIVSGSSQINANSVTNFDTNVDARMDAKTVVSGSSQVVLQSGDKTGFTGATSITTLGTITAGNIIAILPSGTISGSSQVNADSVTNFDTNVDSRMDAKGVISGSSQVSKDTDDVSEGSSNLYFTNARVKARLDAETVISGSSQVNANTITNFDSNVDARMDAKTVISGSGQLLNVATDFGSGRVSGEQFGDSAGSSTFTGSFNGDGSGLTGLATDLTVGADNGSDDTISLASGVLTIAGTANEIETTVTNDQVAVGIVTNPTLTGNVTVTGNLDVQGTTTTVDSTTVQIGDNIIELNGTGATNGGIHVKDATAPNTDTGSLIWDSTNDLWAAGTKGNEIALVNISGTQTLTNKTINGSNNTISNIGNSSLANDGITIAGADTSLGGSISAAAIVNAITGNVVSGSSQVNADSITNFDSNVKSKLDAETVISGSAQVSLGDASGTTDNVSEGSSNLYFTNARVKTRLDAETVISGSSQVNANSITNFDSNVKAKLDADTVISGSSQVVLQSGDKTGFTGATSITTLGTVTAGNVAAILPTGVISGSSQIEGNFLEVNGDNVISGSSQVQLGSATGTIDISDQTNFAVGDTDNIDLILTGDTLTANIKGGVISGSAQLLNVATDFGSGRVSGDNFGDSNGGSTYTGSFEGDGSALTGIATSLTVGADNGSDDTVALSTGTLNFVGTSNEIETTVSNDQIQIGIVTNPTLSGNVTVTGNLNVEGTTTTIDSTTVQIGDRILELNYAAGSGDAGLLVTDVDGTSASGSLVWDASSDFWMGGAAGSEKEFARLNASPTSNRVLKANASGLLVDSLVSDDGTNVTITGTAELRVNGATANSFVFYDSNKSIESVAASTAGDVIQWNGSSFVASNEIDGGTF